MHKIDSDGATEDNRFTEGDAAKGEVATTVSKDWLNAVQGEIVSVIEGAGLELETPGNDSESQLQKAINLGVVDIKNKTIDLSYRTSQKRVASTKQDQVSLEFESSDTGDVTKDELPSTVGDYALSYSYTPTDEERTEIEALISGGASEDDASMEVARRGISNVLIQLLNTEEDDSFLELISSDFSFSEIEKDDDTITKVVFNYGPSADSNTLVTITSGILGLLSINYFDVSTNEDTTFDGELGPNALASIPDDGGGGAIPYNRLFDSELQKRLIAEKVRLLKTAEHEDETQVNILRMSRTNGVFQAIGGPTSALQLNGSYSFFGVDASILSTFNGRLVLKPRDGSASPPSDFPIPHYEHSDIIGSVTFNDVSYFIFQITPIPGFLAYYFEVFHGEQAGTLEVLNDVEENARALSVNTERINTVEGEVSSIEEVTNFLTTDSEDVTEFSYTKDDVVMSPDVNIYNTKVLVGSQVAESSGVLHGRGTNVTRDAYALLTYGPIILDASEGEIRAVRRVPAVRGSSTTTTEYLKTSGGGGIGGSPVQLNVNSNIEYTVDVPASSVDLSVTLTLYLNNRPQTTVTFPVAGNTAEYNYVVFPELPASQQNQVLIAVRRESSGVFVEASYSGTNDVIRQSYFRVSTSYQETITTPDIPETVSYTRIASLRGVGTVDYILMFRRSNRLTLEIIYNLNGETGTFDTNYPVTTSGQVRSSIGSVGTFWINTFISGHTTKLEEIVNDNLAFVTDKYLGFRSAVNSQEVVLRVDATLEARSPDGSYSKIVSRESRGGGAAVIKLLDGTMIQTISKIGVEVNINNGSSPFFTGEYIWTFAEPFLVGTNPVVSVGSFRHNSIGSVGWGAVDGVATPVQVTLQGYERTAKVAGDGLTHIQATAIGRWK